MNWFYPRTAFDLIFPGLLWYICVWIVMLFVLTGALLWDVTVWLYEVLFN